MTQGNDNKSTSITFDCESKKELQRIYYLAKGEGEPYTKNFGIFLSHLVDIKILNKEVE